MATSVISLVNRGMGSLFVCLKNFVQPIGVICLEKNTILISEASNFWPIGASLWILLQPHNISINCGLVASQNAQRGQCFNDQVFGEIVAQEGMEATEELAVDSGEQKVMKSQREVNLDMSREELFILLARLNAQKSVPDYA